MSVAPAPPVAGGDADRADRGRPAPDPAAGADGPRWACRWPGGMAIVAAYDEALLDACRALGVPTELDRITDALERESERLRAEHELRAGRRRPRLSAASQPRV